MVAFLSPYFVLMAVLSLIRASYPLFKKKHFVLQQAKWNGIECELFGSLNCNLFSSWTRTKVSTLVLKRKFNKCGKSFRGKMSFAFACVFKRHLELLSNPPLFPSKWEFCRSLEFYIYMLKINILLYIDGVPYFHL